MRVGGVGDERSERGLAREWLSRLGLEEYGLHRKEMAVV